MFGDFILDSTGISEEITDNENLLWVFDLQLQNSEPTRVTPTSGKCLDHMITSSHVGTGKRQTTIKNHFKVLCEIADVDEESAFREKDVTFRNLKNVKGGSKLNFLFVLDLKLKSLKNCGNLD